MRDNREYRTKTEGAQRDESPKRAKLLYSVIHYIVDTVRDSKRPRHDHTQLHVIFACKKGHGTEALCVSLQAHFLRYTLVHLSEARSFSGQLLEANKNSAVPDWLQLNLHLQFLGRRFLETVVQHGLH